VTPSEADGNILAVQRGDRDAFAALVARYQNRLYRYLLRWDHEPAAAEDLFQQTWMRVAQYIHRFDPQRNFDPWLFAIARNLAVDHLRRRAPEGFQEPLEDGLRVYDRDPANTPGALEQLLSSERAHWVQKALEAQPRCTARSSAFILRDPLPTPCMSCGMEVPQAFAYCPGCGASIHPICPQCSKPLQPGWMNCPHCGLRIVQAS